MLRGLKLSIWKRFAEKEKLKGVEIYIFKNKIKCNSTVSIVITKDEGLIQSTNLGKYGASFFFTNFNSVDHGKLCQFKKW